MLPLEFEPDASREAARSADHYDRKLPGLGIRFENDVEFDTVRVGLKWRM